MAQEDRTELPTQRRKEEASRKGQVARSTDLAQAASLAAALAALSWAGARMVNGLGIDLTTGLARLATARGHELTPGEVNGLAAAAANSIAFLVGPIAVAAVVAAVGAQIAQSGWNVATEALTLNFGKLNPANGFRQFGLKRGGVQTLKAVVIVGAAFYLSYPFVANLSLDAQRMVLVSPLTSASEGWDAARGLLWKSVLLFGTIGAADFFWQRRQLTESLRMTKQEVKDDMRMSEGSPEVKGRIRKVMAESFRRRMMAAVPKATVVITNPTHYAVALEYSRARNVAPMVVAKGQGHLAQKIKQIAREAGVPMVENVPLAQALYKTVEVGETIPGNLFEAVAEVLAYLIRLKQLTLN
jgi:flagellar biosynthetic protein FlhB